MISELLEAQCETGGAAGLGLSPPSWCSPVRSLLHAVNTQSKVWYFFLGNCFLFMNEAIYERAINSYFTLRGFPALWNLSSFRSALGFKCQGQEELIQMRNCIKANVERMTTANCEERRPVSQVSPQPRAEENQSDRQTSIRGLKSRPVVKDLQPTDWD